MAILAYLLHYAREWETPFCIAMSVTCVVYMLWGRLR